MGLKNIQLSEKKSKSWKNILCDFHKSKNSSIENILYREIYMRNKSLKKEKGMIKSQFRIVVTAWRERKGCNRTSPHRTV